MEALGIRSLLGVVSMDEQSIFLAALQKETLEERAVFLAEACGNDESIRHEVEMLFTKLRFQSLI
jgi:hypothetical protein